MTPSDEQLAADDLVKLNEATLRIAEREAEVARLSRQIIKAGNETCRAEMRAEQAETRLALVMKAGMALRAALEHIPASWGGAHEIKMWDDALAAVQEKP
jgi:hypothetical protein